MLLCTNEPLFIIAEISANHLGSLARALRLIEVAKEAGADAVKLQSYTADRMTLDCDRPDFTIEGGPWAGRRLHDLYREAETPREWHAALYGRARELGITCFSSVFDIECVDFLEALEAPIYKIASFEIVDTPLIAAAARTGKPIIISTGMASDAEITDALKAAGRSPVTLLHCVSAYPAKPEEMNLQRIAHLRQTFGVRVGLSDHTLGGEAVVASVALGARIIEKHITLSRADGGPDAAFSLDPDEFAAMVTAARNTLAAMQPPKADSEGTQRQLRRSLYAIADIAPGERLTAANVASIRPGHGMPPKHWPEVLAKTAAQPITRGTPITRDLLR